MKLLDLPIPTLDKIKAYRWDRSIEKHEGPESWASVLKYYEPDFMMIDGYPVLLPVPKEQHRNITILRCIVSQDEQTLTLFLKDTTYVDDIDDPRMALFYAGFVAICDRIPGEDFYLTIFYHEWYIIDNACRQILKPAVPLLLAEPKIRVSATRFDQIVAAARQAGLPAPGRAECSGKPGGGV